MTGPSSRGGDHSPDNRLEIRQLLVDARDCSGPLNDAQRLAAALQQAAAAVGAKERGGCQAEFVPHGVTAVIVLAQSHMTISTWPEHDFVMVDILFCDPDMDPQDAWRSLEETLQPREASTQLVVRHIGR